MLKTSILSLLIVLNAECAISQGVAASKDGSLRNIDARAFIPGPSEAYLATKETVYRSSLPGKEWRPVFTLSQGENEITCMAVKSGSVFIGTKRGLFRISANGPDRSISSRSMVSEKNRVLCINADADSESPIYIGTEGGVLESSDRGENWVDISGALKDRYVKSLARNGGSIFAVADDGLYASTEPLKGGWERLIVNRLTEDQSESGDQAAIDSAEESANPIPSCVVSSEGRLYAGIGNRVMISDDNGKSWRGLTRSGLAGIVNGVLIMGGSGKVFCATTKGVFEYIDNHSEWKELYMGTDRRLCVKDIVSAGGDETAVWGVTDNGLYRYGAGDYVRIGEIDVERNIEALKVSQGEEPSFNELRRAAIRYCDVCPEKIEKWQRESRLKALLPRISVGVNKDRSTNYEIYTSATKEYVTVGPDDISDGWDLSLSWELGELIWSDDQTNIDVRSKLMVQLRNDILDDLRRAYYERRRLQLEIALEPVKDMRSAFEKEMRVDELTQVIDDLTGNYFSGHKNK